jgi:hypothetical protein
VLTVSSLVVDPRVFAIISIASALLGVLGSLFFVYDLLGRKRGPLRWLLKTFVPTLLGGISVGLIFLLGFTIEDLLSRQTDLALVIDAALLGAFLGLYNGLFVSDPATSSKLHFPFSFVDAVIGFLVTTLVVGLLLWLHNGYIAMPIRTIAGGAGGAIIAGLWRSANRLGSQAEARPPLFTWIGLLLGSVAGFTLVFVILFAQTLPKYGVDLNLVGSIAIICFFIGVFPGAITGALTRYLYWWVNTLDSKAMEALGIFLILLGFLAQIVEPTFQLINP